MSILSKEQLSQLKQHIDRQLEIRCINVKTTVEETTQKTQRENLAGFELTSTKFQTVPVIHFNLSIINFGGGIIQDKENEDILNIYLPVAVKYDRNCEDLFVVKARINKKVTNQVFFK